MANPVVTADTLQYTYLDQLDTPQFVADMLAVVEAAGADPDHLTAMKHEYMLSYYYGGLVVVARKGTDRNAIAFSGPPAEVGAAVRKLSREQAGQLTLFIPDPIAVHVAALPLDKRVPA